MESGNWYFSIVVKQRNVLHELNSVAYKQAFPIASKKALSRKAPGIKFREPCAASSIYTYSLSQNEAVNRGFTTYLFLTLPRDKVLFLLMTQNTDTEVEGSEETLTPIFPSLLLISEDWNSLRHINIQPRDPFNVGIITVQF